MTEAEWLASDDLNALIKFVCGRRRNELGIANRETIIDYTRRAEHPALVYPRKRRLFFCACCRRYPAPLPDVARYPIKVAERFADGDAPETARQYAMFAIEATGSAMLRGPGPFDDGCLLRAAAATVLPFTDESYCCDSQWVDPWNAPYLDPDDDDGGFVLSAAKAMRAVLWAEGDAVGMEISQRWRFFHPRFIKDAGFPIEGTRWHAELVAQCNLWRDLFGNTFRPVTLNRKWITAAVRQIADAAYQERDFGRLPVLADALEEAGCDNPLVLNHCREPGEHARGCWLVDQVLGKE